MKSGLFSEQPLSPAARRVIFAGCIGFAVDFFDIYLPVLVLAPVIGYFEPKGLSATTTVTIYYFTIAATLLGRPCGAVIFGHDGNVSSFYLLVPWRGHLERRWQVGP